MKKLGVESEANPIVKHLCKKFGINKGMYFTGLITFFVVILGYIIATKSVLLAVTIISFAAVINNLTISVKVKCSE